MVLGGHFRNWAELGGKTVQSHLIFYTASWNEYKNLWYQAGDTAIQPALSNGFTQLFHTKMAFLISSDSGWIQKLQSTRKEFLLAADLHHPRAIVSLFTFTIGHWSALWWPMIPPMYFIISFTKQWAGCAASWVCPWMPKSLATPWLLTLAWMATSATLSSIHLGKESHVSSAWQQCLQQTCPFTQQLWLAECGLYISRVWKRNPFWTKDGPAGCPRYLKASASSK